MPTTTPPPPIDTAGGSTGANPDYGRAPDDWTPDDQVAIDYEKQRGAFETWWGGLEIPDGAIPDPAAGPSGLLIVSLIVAGVAAFSMSAGGR